MYLLITVLNTTCNIERIRYISELYLDILGAMCYVLYLPGTPEKMPSSSTSTGLHNGETSLHNMRRTAVSMSPELSQ